MDYRRLGRLPFQVSALGFGTWALGGPSMLGGKPNGWGPQNPRESLRAIRRALDLGITFFDTADLYGLGASETFLGEALGSDRERAVVCTKFGVCETPEGHVIKDFSPPRMRACVEQSLRRLKRDWIDLLLLHGPSDDMDWTHFDAAPLLRLKTEGKIRGFGVSCRSYRGAENVLSHGFGDALEAIYNLLDRRLAHRALPEAIRVNMGVIARVPLASGFLTGKFNENSPAFSVADVRSTLSPDEIFWRRTSARQLSPLALASGGLTSAALRFGLSHPGISTVIAGMRSVEQVEENTQAASRGPLAKPWLDQVERLAPKVYKGWD